MHITISKTLFAKSGRAYVMKNAEDTYTVFTRETIFAFQAMELVGKFLKKEEEREKDKERAAFN